MADYMVRAISADGAIRAFVARTTDLADEARRRHDTWPTTTAALGRTLTAAGLLSATLKSPGESVTIRIAGDGPVGGMICDGDEQGQVRGFPRNPHADLEPKNGKFDVAGIVGAGLLHVTRQLAVEGIYTSTSQLVSGEIGDDLTYYLTQSEQTPSAVGLGVRVAPDGSVVAAGGYLLQLLPAASDEDRDLIEANLRSLGAVSRVVEEGLSPEEVLEVLMAGITFTILERRELHFACTCSRQRALDAMAALDPAELHEIAMQDGGAELSCQFCAEVYRFGADELLADKGPSQ